MTIGWGILAPGDIAHQFATELALVPEARIAAVGSRDLGRAEAFSSRFGGTPYGSYAELVEDPAVDVVYVASPHGVHPEHTRLAMAAGKAVLCEKPIAISADEATALFAEARDRDVFLMEAMWTACHPLIRAMLGHLAEGRYGEVRQVSARLGFVMRPDEDARLFDPALGGGSLLDMGIYPVTLATLVLGDPEATTALATLSDRGVDLDIAITARYASGAVAALSSSMTACLANTATIATTTGHLDLTQEFHHPTSIRWTPLERSDASIPPAEEITGDEPIIGEGYGNEILEVHRCLAAGRLTSDLVSPEQSIAVLTQLDRLRQQAGIEL